MHLEVFSKQDWNLSSKNMTSKSKIGDSSHVFQDDHITPITSVVIRALESES